MSKNMCVQKNNLKISIIIPFRDKPALLERCVESVVRHAGRVTYEIVLVDNRSRRRATRQVVAELAQRYGQRVRVMHYDKPFNYAALNNWAVRHAQEEYIVFLNNDTEVLSDNWLGELVKRCRADDVGIVGVKLLYPDGRIQHAGLGVKNGDMAHLWAKRRDSALPEAPFNKEQDVLAVTAACMMVRREVFEALGGFDAEHFGIAYNDVDLCLRAREEGWRVVYTPAVAVRHEESATRGRDVLKRFLQPRRYREFLREREALFARHGEIFGKVVIESE